MKIRIISADFGNAQAKQTIYLPEQEYSKFTIETFMYTDSIYFSREKSLSPRLKGKIPKILDWLKNDADYYIWMDSYYTITSSRVHNLVKYADGYGICLNKHYARSTIKDEANFVIQEMLSGNNYLLERYSGEPIQEQVTSYLSDSSFIDNSLYALGFFIYTKTFIQNYANLMQDWFFHNCYWSVQDQLSLPYLLHKYKVKPNIFNFEAIYSNPYAVYNR